MNRIKIDVKQASEFMAAGYEIECYVSIPKIIKAQHGGKRTAYKVILPSAKLVVSVDMEGPTKGLYMAVWGKLKAKLWANGSLTETHTREEIEKAIKQISPETDAGFFMYLVNGKHCLRVVE